MSDGNSFMDVSTPEHSDGGGRGEIREEQPMAPVPEVFGQQLWPS